jgi:outer membrane protein assembly factor BamD
VTVARGFANGVAVVLLALTLAGCGASTMPAVHSEPERLATAQRMMDTRHWASAIELLKAYVDTNGGGTNSDLATYLLGECYLRTHEWAMAATQFERMAREFPESDSTASASFRLGEALDGQARPPDFDQEYTSKAIDQWRTYLATYPGHWLNDEANRRIDRARSRLAIKIVRTGELYVKLKLPQPARAYFERIVTEFGDTLLLGRAMLGLARCDALEGKKDSAIARYREIEQKFPGALAASAAHERARIARKRS